MQTVHKFKQIQLNTGCDINSSLSSNHSEFIEKSVTAAIRISMTYHDLCLITGLSRPGKCYFQISGLSRIIIIIIIEFL